MLLGVQRAFWVVGLLIFCGFLYYTALPGTLPAGRDADDGIAGTYVVNGVDPTGLEYSGTLIISESGGNDYTLEWIVTGSIARGRGVLAGSELAVDWESVAAADPRTGSAFYIIQPDGRMLGTRTVDGVDEPGTEEVFPEA